MARTAAPSYRCSACGWESPRFVGRCARCQEWNTLEQALAAPNRSAPAARRPAAVAPAPTLTFADVTDRKTDV